VAGYQYKIDDLKKAVEDNAKNYQDLEKSRKTVGSQRIAIVLLVILIGVLVFAIVILFFKFRDVKEEPFMHQSPRPQKPIARPRENGRPEGKPGKVMQTVGAAPKAPLPKPPQKPGARPAGSGPAAGGAARPARPQGGAQAPVRPTAKPMPQSNGQPAPGGRPAPAQRPAPHAGGQAAGQAPGWKSRNFMAEDDEFEFEFLNWDNPEKGDK
jgi:hypothetical protein